MYLRLNCFIGQEFCNDLPMPFKKQLSWYYQFLKYPYEVIVAIFLRRQGMVSFPDRRTSELNTILSTETFNDNLLTITATFNSIPT